jgi:hypothetical protein
MSMRLRVKEGFDDLKYLTSGREYQVIGLDDEYFRIVDDTGEPILVPRTVFDITDDVVPEDWIWNRYADDEFYADPPELHPRGFYEDYFDGKEYARKAMTSYLQRIGLSPLPSSSITDQHPSTTDLTGNASAPPTNQSPE